MKEGEMKESKKLYQVTLTGMTYSPPQYGISYVVARDPDSAYKAVKKFLDDNDIGFLRERGLDNVKLLADSVRGGHSNMLYEGSGGSNGREGTK